MSRPQPAGVAVKPWVQPGQIEIFRYSGWHEGLDTSYHGCNRGRKQAFCCDLPLNDGSAFLPVPLENLFPVGESFPDSYTTSFAETFDTNDDDLSSKAAGTDPNERAFTWVVMVGEVEEVQSFNKRDGSHLELYDCPDTHRNDYSVQKAKAVCVGGTQDDNNCEEIILGGVEGTVVRMPPHCGPDQYVRAVRFELANSTIPSHLRKRHPSAERVYEFHYDYNFHSLRRDGGEVYFRADFSTHVGYWYELVQAAHDSPVKRSADNWRELGRRFWSETKEDWRKRFDALLVNGNQGLRKHYEWNECLFEAKAVCGIAEFDSEARVFGELNTTMDFGTSLIGTLRNFDFQEAYSFWNQEHFSMKMGAKFHVRARLYLDSGWMSIGSFHDFGMNAFLKAILTVNPYFHLDTRVEADAYISAGATTEISVSNERFRYFLPDDLGNNPTSIGGDFFFNTAMSPISATGDMEPKVGGGIVFSFRPSVIANVGVDLRGKQYIDTDVTLSIPGSIRLDAALSTSCIDGIKFDVSGKLGVDFSVTNGLPVWDSAIYHWKDSTEDPLELPESTRSTRAYSAKGVYCTDDDDQDALDCNMNPLDPETSTGNPGSELMRRGLISARNTKSLAYCDTKGGSHHEGFDDENRGVIRFTNYLSPSELVRDYYPDAATYDAEDPNSCTNLNLIKLAKTPQHPSQLVQRFFNAQGMQWSNLTNPGAPANQAARKYTNPTKGATDQMAWCAYMYKWWQNITDTKYMANSVLGNEFPGYHWRYTDEMVLLEAGFNQQVKNGWFSGKRLYHEGSMNGYIRAHSWFPLAKTLKAHILMWQYYNIDSIKKTPVKQANRIEAKLKDLEDSEIMKKASPSYDKPYISQGLAALWTEWVRNEHKRVVRDVKKFSIFRTKRAYDLNRPNDPKVKLQPGQMVQRNRDIVTMFEIYLAPVQGLQAWDIDWDMDTSDESRESGSDDDGMDIDPNRRGNFPHRDS
ncbi:hypothetical protein BJY00DRAFT_313208 [Aspergillus carlsbadensis]|nr:hypothetical protein BJY00DRAFT_313208 [Aspergillus carlsbadensis]